MFQTILCCGKTAIRPFCRYDIATIYVFFLFDRVFLLCIRSKSSQPSSSSEVIMLTLIFTGRTSAAFYRHHLRSKKVWVLIFFLSMVLWRCGMLDILEDIKATATIPLEKFLSHLNLLSCLVTTLSGTSACDVVANIMLGVVVDRD